MKMTALKRVLKHFGIAVSRFQQPSKEQWAVAGNSNLYDVYQSGLTYHPWDGDSRFRSHYDVAEAYTLVPLVHCWIIYSMARQAMLLQGEVWECGVYRGGTATLLKRLRDEVNSRVQMRLFDTFDGMPATDMSKDVHCRGDFVETSLAAVKALVGTDGVSFHQGIIPQTFHGLERASIAFAHIDLDIYDGIIESCRFIYPRLIKGGVIVFDDCGAPSCPGALAAIEEFFRDRPEFPLILPTGQALVYKI